jgi:NarL family two-component system response regulator LiaR
MRKSIFLYAFAFAALVFLLKYLEHRYLRSDLKLEFYLGTIAFLFTTLGVWAGLKLTRKKSAPPLPVTSGFVLNENLLRQSGISKREYEVLELMASGLSNQEIADKLFVSLNTIKTHTSNLFLKLDVKRRTQAIQKAKELQLIP